MIINFYLFLLFAFFYEIKAPPKDGKLGKNWHKSKQGNCLNQSGTITENITSKNIQNGKNYDQIRQTVVKSEPYFNDDDFGSINKLAKIKIEPIENYDEKTIRMGAASADNENFVLKQEPYEVKIEMNEEGCQINDSKINEVDDQNEEKKRKMKILKAFEKIKKEFVRIFGNTNKMKEWKIEQRIAKKLNSSKSEIYKWKRESGLKEITKQNNLKKWERIVNEFMEEKEKYLRKKEHKGKKKIHHREIDDQIAKKWGTNSRTIYRWKKKLGQTQSYNSFSAEEKHKLIKKYDMAKVNNEILKEKN